jgi:GGDEF domain-containing protein
MPQAPLSSPFFSPAMPLLRGGPILMVPAVGQSVGTIFDNESEIISVTEGMSFVAVTSTGEVIAITEALSLAGNTTATENPAISESASFAGTASVAETAAISETQSLAGTISSAETIALTEASALSGTSSSSDTIAVIESSSTIGTSATSETVAVTETQSNAASTLTAEVITTAENQSIIVTVSQGDAIAITESYSFDGFINLADVVSVGETVIIDGAPSPIPQESVTLSGGPFAENARSHHWEPLKQSDVEKEKLELQILREDGELIAGYNCTMLTECLTKFGKQISSVDREDIENSFNEHLKTKSEYDAAISALGEYHKGLFDETNDLRSQVGLKPAKYRPADVSKILAKQTPVAEKATSSEEPKSATPETTTATEAKTISHPNEKINGKPIVSETADGKAVVANPENKSGVSVVKDRSAEAVPESSPESPSATKSRDEINADMIAEFKRRRDAGEPVPKEFSSNPTDKKIQKNVEAMRDSFIRDWHSTIFDKPETGFEITSQDEPKTGGVEGIVKRERENRRSAERQAETSTVTGLPNKEAFKKAQARIESDPNTEVTSIDLNNFKNINDKNSHIVGDQALKDAGEALQNAAKATSPQAQVFHMSGDEFLVSSPKGTGQDIVKAADGQFSKNQYGEVSGSIAGHSANTYAEAEKGLPAAKAARKNRDTIPADGSENQTANVGGGSAEPAPASRQEQPRKSEGRGGQTPPEGESSDPGPAEGQPGEPRK